MSDEFVVVEEHIHSVLRISKVNPDSLFSASILNKIPESRESPLWIIVFCIILVQLLVTYGYTNAKRFSTRALIRNVSFGLGLYYFISTGNLLYLAIPILLEIVVEWVKYQGYQLDKYIATEYQYSDYWRDICKQNPLFSNFSEGLYDDIFGLDTRDHSEENVRKIEEWTKKIYDESHKNKSSSFVDASGNTHLDIHKIKKIGDENKFRTISQQCQIKPGMKILEIGFGEGDFMLYIRDTYGISPIGVSISEQQVELAKSQGFTAHHMNMWEMTPEVLGTFDLIIQCGNLEYVRCCGETSDKYGEYFSIVSKLLAQNGKYFITCIHTRDGIYDHLDSDDWLKAFFIGLGNDGGCPLGKDALIPYTKQNDLQLVSREERTNDYWLTSVFFMSQYQYTKEKNNIMSVSGLVEALIKTIAAPYYVHTYITYSPTADYHWVPWNWLFNPKKRNGKYESPMTLEYMLFQKGGEGKLSDILENV